MVEYKSLREIQQAFWREIKLLVIKTVYHFVDSNLEVEISSKNRG